MLTTTHPQRRTRSAHRAAICAARIRPGGPAAGYGHPAPTAGAKQYAPIQAARAGVRQVAQELIA